MGQYSYSQLSSSDECDLDLACLLQGEADAYTDEADSQLNVTEALQYSLQPEADDGIPKTCYCGGQPVFATAYTSKDPGRRYYTCDNVYDGDIHVWKWWDIAVMEEMSDTHREVRHVKVQANESEKKLVKVEVTVGELAQKRSWLITKGVLVVVGAMVLLSMVVMFKRLEHCLEELHRLQRRVSHH